MNMTTMMLTRPPSAMMPEELEFHLPPWPCTREEGLRRRRLAELQGRALDAMAMVAAGAAVAAENPLGFDYDDDGEDDTDLDDDDDDFDDEEYGDEGGDFDERLGEERPWWG